ncbi:MAG: thiamine ABC transporter substrate-binding protein [Anaerolineales bacterium]
MKRSFLVFLLVLCLTLLPACRARQPATLTVMTHDDFAISEEVIAEFEQQHNVEVVILRSGSVGEALNKAILSAEAPLADVFYGVDNTFLSRALEAGIFEPYESPRLADIPDAFELDPQHRALPVDYGDVCLNYDIAWFEQRGLPLPQRLDDLLDPAYRGLLVVENPATSSTGLSFLLATIAAFGEDGYLDYWAGLRANGLVVVDDWGTAYYTNFSGSSGRGPQPLVVSYASSPAAEVIYADPPVETAPTAAITAPGTCFRQIEFVGILRGAANRPLAEAFVDFMLDTRFQEDMPLQMFVYPVNQRAALPPEFVRWAQTAEQPASLDPALIAANRERWIAAWAEVVLR